MIDLSILICGVHTRYDTFLPKIQKQLFDQYNELSPLDKDRVEIIILTDNKKQMLGRKRNVMVGMAQGEYIVFVDDDDRVADDYIIAILEATVSDADCIVFRAEVVLNNESPKVCHFSKDFKTDYDTADGYYRVPNHICAVKRSMSVLAAFPSIPYREDFGYSKALLPMLATQHAIDKILYYYDFNAGTSEVQEVL